MTFLSRRRATPVEQRSYGLLFFLTSVLLAMATASAVVDEVWVRRPWKKYQSEFANLELQKAAAGLRKAEQQFARPEVQSRVASLERDLQTAEDALRSLAYRAAVSELHAIRQRVSDHSQKLQFTRSRSDETYYLYQTARHAGRPAAKEKRRLDELGRESDSLSLELASLQQTRLALESQVRSSEQRAEILRDSLTALKADLSVWHRKIETAKRRDIRVEQIVLHDFDRSSFGGRVARVDRCTTCHLGIEQPGFEKERPPFARHSYLIDYHPVEAFGCTPCHGGQGVALTVEAAHGQVEFWPNPLLGEGIRERLCGSCHQEGPQPPEAPLLSDGRQLFESSGCLGCHNVENYAKVPNIGPPLNRIALKVKPAWLVKWISSPKGYLPSTKMPNFHFTEEEARAVRAYLLEASERKPRSAPLTPGTQDTKSIKDGETLFRVARCVSCHSVDGVGGTIAPDLANVASKVRLDWLLDWLRNPRAYQPNTKMPQYRFTDQEILLIAAYLQSLTDAEDEQVSFSASPEETNRGRKLVTEYGCLGCHDPAGQEAVGGKVGADLTFFGDKPIENLDFGDVLDIPRTREAWVEAKLLNPWAFSTERIQLKMPDFGFRPREARALATVLLGFTEEQPPEGFLRRRRPESTYAPPGQFGRLTTELNCLTCHRINGRGGTLAPDLSYEGSRATAEWLKKFLRNPTALRPTLTVRMPKFNLPEGEIDTIVNYIQTALVHNDIPSPFLEDARFPPEEIEQGRRLYFEKYRCQSCHQINYEGGTMGPELVSSDTNLRERRTAGWVYSWIRNPKALDPATVEPALGLSDQEALAITKYLLSF